MQTGWLKNRRIGALVWYRPLYSGYSDRTGMHVSSMWEKISAFDYGRVTLASDGNTSAHITLICNEWGEDPGRRQLLFMLPSDCAIERDIYKMIMHKESGLVRVAPGNSFVMHDEFVAFVGSKSVCDYAVTHFAAWWEIRDLPERAVAAPLIRNIIRE